MSGGEKGGHLSVTAAALVQKAAEVKTNLLLPTMILVELENFKVMDKKKWAGGRNPSGLPRESVPY